MNINELDKFDLADAVKFHDRLNPRLWGRDEHLLPQVRERLLAIAADFQEFLGVPDLDVQDITVSGSNAAYSYTPGSDIDLHLVVRMPEQNSEVFAELFNAKKYQYNDEHDIRIGGADVELYVQPSDQPHHSQGIYSVQNNDWLQVPRRRRAEIDDHCVQHKTEDLAARIDQAIATESLEQISRLWDKIKTMRQVGLDRTGEFGSDNLAFKMLRRSGHLERLKQAKLLAKDRALSLDERRKKKTKFRWGYGGFYAPGFAYGSDSGEGGGDGGGGESMREGHYGSSLSSEDGVAPSTQLFLNEDNTEDIVHEFIQDTAEFLGIRSMPQIVLHRDDDWSTDNNSFGMYVPDQHVLHVNMQNRHLMDVLRTTAHELAHCRQHEISALPDNAGDTGSPIENEAHAVAGIVMRNFADKHPELFAHGTIKESSGYIPTEAEKNDPRFVMALTADVRPGATGLNANRMALKTDSQGRPQLLRANGQVDSVKDLAESLRSELAALDRKPSMVSKQPQPSHGDGRRREINAPLGPETPPTMPAGTVRVDVSDMYDWYKLGQHISNMKGLGRHDFGAGPPSSIISFGDEETEHKFIKDLAATGLKVTDIDPRDPNQPPGMRQIKTDPTYNVAEADAARTAKSAIDQTEVFGVRGYRARCLEPGCEWHSRSYDRIKQAQDSAKKHAAAHIKPGVAEGSVHDRFMQRLGRKLQQSGYTQTGTGTWSQGPDGRYVNITPLPDGQYGWELRRVNRRGKWYSGVDTSKAVVAIFKEYDIFSKHPVDESLAEQNELVESLRQEFALLEDEFIGEIRMSPTNLRAEAAKTGALAGMEFEMIVLGVKQDDPEPEPDYDQDERCRSIDDAVEFFNDGDFNGRREVERLRERMQEDFSEWLMEKIDEDWANNPEEYIYQYLVRDVDASTIGEIIGQDLSDADGPTKQQVAQAAEIVNDNEQQPYYDDARDWHREEYQDGWDESDWLDSQDLDVMSAIENAYEISWPHWRYDDGESAADIDTVANDFSEAVGMPVNASQQYHGGRREAGHYVVEPDGSLRPDSDDDTGLEFVSPPMPIDQMLDQLKKVREWAGRYGCYTNDSTGLHINVSVPEFSNDQLDYVKLALLLGDKYVLDQFGRSSNTYAKSALGIVQDRVRANPNTAQALLDRMRGHMEDLATKAIHSGDTSKYTSINTKEGYIEFRSPGGDWLDENFDKVENTLLRFTVALKAAMDPEAYREEYLKKLYKLLEPTAEGQKGSDTVRYFADYVAGKIPAAALRSFVKQAQIQRRIAKEPASGKKYWWRVYKDGRDVRNTAMIEVVASSEQEARDKAAAEFGIFSSEYKAYMDAVALRPYVETEPEYEIFQVAGNRVVQTFRAADNDAALAYFDRTISAGDRPYYDVRRAGSGTAEPAAPQQFYYINNGSYNTSTIRASSTEDAIRQFRNRMRNERMSSSYSLVSSDNQVLARGTDTEPAAQQPAGGFEFELEPSQTDIENRLGLPDQTGDANYEVFNRNTQRPVFVFIANTDAEASRKYSDWLAASGLPNAEDYGFRERARPGSTLDIQRRRADQSAQAAVASTRQQQSGGGNFTGVWLILDPDGNVIHSFAGVGNVQSDANRVAMQWLRANPGSMQAGVTVVPEML